MLSIQNLLIKEEVYFTLETSFSEVTNILLNKGLSHFPVVENGFYLGNLSLNEAEMFSDNQLVLETREFLEVFYVRESSYWFEVLELFSKFQANMVPVLNVDNKLIGYYYFNDVYPFFNRMPFLKENGTTIIVEKEIFSYSISQISQILEINNSKILGIVVSEITVDTAQIIIKTTTININEIIQSLRRFGYDIISEHIEDQFLSDLKERSDYLDKYLNI